MENWELVLIVGSIWLTGWFILTAVNKNTEQILTRLSKIYEKDDN